MRDAPDAHTGMATGRQSAVLLTILLADVLSVPLAAHFKCTSASCFVRFRLQEGIVWNAAHFAQLNRDLTRLTPWLTAQRLFLQL